MYSLHLAISVLKSVANIKCLAWTAQSRYGFSSLRRLLRLALSGISDKLLSAKGRETEI